MKQGKVTGYKPGMFGIKVTIQFEDGTSETVKVKSSEGIGYTVGSSVTLDANGKIAPVI